MIDMNKNKGKRVRSFNYEWVSVVHQFQFTFYCVSCYQSQTLSGFCHYSDYRDVSVYLLNDRLSFFFPFLFSSLLWICWAFPLDNDKEGVHTLVFGLRVMSKSAGLLATSFNACIFGSTTE
jgi:hypothetical protein